MCLREQQLGLENILCRIDEPVCMINVDTSGNETLYFYHYDGLGSVIALSDTSGNIVGQYAYTPFGLPTITTTSGYTSPGNPYMFTGRRYDPETGLYYYRARMYSPTLGCFMQPDPIGYSDGMNIYTYCGNNPINWIDPSGLFQFGHRPLGYAPWVQNFTWFLYPKECVDQNPNEKVEDRSEYTMRGKIYDDVLMRQAEENVNSRWDDKNNPEYEGYSNYTHNCQHYCDDLRKEYKRLYRELSKEEKREVKQRIKEIKRKRKTNKNV